MWKANDRRRLNKMLAGEKVKITELKPEKKNKANLYKEK